MTIEKIPKTFNARFDKEVFYAIADLLTAKYGRDKTEAVSRAIFEARNRLNGTGLSELVPLQQQAKRDERNSRATSSTIINRS